MKTSERKTPGASTRTVTSIVQRIKNKLRHLIAVALGFLTPQPKRTHIDEYGNTYFFSNRTTEKTVSASQACAGGRFRTVSTIFINTDNLEVRLAPTKSKRNIADSWRIVRICPDTGSEVCIISRPHIRM